MTSAPMNHETIDKSIRKILRKCNHDNVDVTLEKLKLQHNSTNSNKIFKQSSLPLGPFIPKSQATASTTTNTNHITKTTTHNATISKNNYNNYNNNNDNLNNNNNNTNSNNKYTTTVFCRQSLCFYAASSVILALCYFTTPSAATEAAHSL